MRFGPSSFIMILAAVMPSLCMPGNSSSIELRDTDTCGDPNQAMIFYSGLAPSKKHSFNVMPQWINADLSGDDYIINSPGFRAWVDPQTGTVPLWFLHNPTTQDNIFLMSLDGSTPSSAGFVPQLIVGYVYPTQICGSIPLHMSVLGTAKDHYWTTNLLDHNYLVTRTGWQDGGIIAYVLALDG